MRNKDLKLFATKLTERIPDLSNANKQYQQISEKVKHKINKAIKNNYSATKNF